MSPYLPDVLLFTTFVLVLDSDSGSEPEGAEPEGAEPEGGEPEGGEPEGLEVGTLGLPIASNFCIISWILLVFLPVGSNCNCLLTASIKSNNSFILV